MDITSNFLALIQSVNYILLSIIVILMMEKTIFKSVLKYLNIYSLQFRFKDIFTMSVIH